MNLGICHYLPMPAKYLSLQTGEEMEPPTLDYWEGIVEKLQLTQQQVCVVHRSHGKGVALGLGSRSGIAICRTHMAGHTDGTIVCLGIAILTVGCIWFPQCASCLTALRLVLLPCARAAV